MNISAPFIKRPIGTSLLAIGLFVIGLMCYLRLGVAALPNIQIPIIFVHATQSGADASTMASTVTAPLERHLGQLPGIDRMRSSSSESSSLVVLVFQSSRNIDSAAQDIQTAINASQSDLPSGLGTPMYSKANPNDDPVIAIALTSETQSADELYNVADSLLAQRLRQITGISSVDIAGASTPAVRVDVDLRALNALGLTPDDLRNAVRAANVTSPTGFLSDGNTTMAIISNDSVSKAADFAQLAISTQSNGRIVRLGDVATVYDGQQDAYQAAWFDGKPAVVMYAFTCAGANIVETVDQVKAQIPELRSYLQPGTTLTPYFDRTPTIRASLHEVQATLMISLAMVILTMALFLRRLAPTLIAAVTVPLSLAGSALVMYVLGFTLNNLSLLALVIAIGFVVDDAIVVIENVMRHLDEGMSRLDAALAGAREIGFTIVSITASLVAVFIPMLFASGMIGAFFREFTVTLVAAIVVSMLVSLTLTPALCSRFLSPHAEPEKPGRFGAWLDRMHERMLRVYTVALDFSLRHALLLSLTPLLLIAATIFLGSAVKKGSFPAQDTGLIWGRANSSAAVSFADMVSRQRRITDMLMADPAVKTVGARLGSGRQGSSASFNIELKKRDEGRRDTTAEVVARLSAKADRYPDLDLRLRAIQDLPSDGGGGTSQGAQYRVSLQGNDLAQLQEWLPKLQAALKKNPHLRDVGTDVDTAGLRQNIVIDRAKAARLGISVGAIDGALYGAFGQRSISTIYSDLNQYSVVVNALPSQTATPKALDQIFVPNRAGQMVPITAVATQVPGLAPPQIIHENQYTTMDLSYNLAPGVSTGEADLIIKSTVEGLRMPDGIRLSGDDSFNVQLSPNSMGILLLAAVLTVYIVLGMLYESLMHPVTILSTLPAAGVGALLALFITNTELSVISMIALVLLIGIVKKNAIMMIDFALVAQRVHGMDARAAAREASIVRFRPIMMTTMVAILAAVPLAVGLGEGSELRRPLGIAMIGGLVFSQSLTLLSTPALYVIFSCLSERWKARRARARARRAERAAARRPAAQAH
ncbi:acriflavin resistance protein [Xanthomonas phaseoli pv. phaseoli]|uniref:Multidrug resistance protein MdtC n=1 Tax=Xanthomonas campestris pv. phaseoli TaxID=317013 RepID=A0AB38E4G5_XANCH|nr:MULTISPECIES: efflux RND transporter permease subunit [Xanthomonas]ATS22714.1 efflux RND transporter permease subunit [Xanthomonas phaseoli pv. phaseoli]ATS25619.1 efflux RND transporter permease subunit [Xanthomonas phaseoli pv. phaseoli]ATS30877.1 efflux RND transporter permease subunit [Xanthomonas phaseoli pv. phaseoli]ATS33871.1 efflux RND transporter permease subunit [Xanthomonas phaseoli pv. phaseoli]AZU14835.1 acriflavin resistance protein [Xanthomonas phaseoli pv. phaseoli]